MRLLLSTSLATVFCTLAPLSVSAQARHGQEIRPGVWVVCGQDVDGVLSPTGVGRVCVQTVYDPREDPNPFCGLEHVEGYFGTVYHCVVAEPLTRDAADVDADEAVVERGAVAPTPAFQAELPMQDSFSVSEELDRVARLREAADQARQFRDIARECAEARRQAGRAVSCAMSY